MAQPGLSSTHPGILGVGIGPRLFVAVAVVVVLWAAMAWAVTAPALDDAGRNGTANAATRMPAAPGA